jgi:hypothetical protein
MLTKSNSSISLKSTFAPHDICCILVPSCINVPPLSRLFVITDLQGLLEWILLNQLRVTCLRSQVESQVTASGQVILNQERNLIGQAKLDSLGKSRSLAKVDKVFEGEGQRDGFGELNFNIQVWLLDVVVASKSDGTIANITRAGELDTILGRLN